MSDLRPSIQTALQAFQTRPLREAALGLLDTLGYSSERTIPWTLDTFRELADRTAKPLSPKDQEDLRRIKHLDLLFQLTDAEISRHGDLFDSSAAVDDQLIHSYLFFAVDLPPGPCTRGELSTLARIINKPLSMPGIVLFRHGMEDEPLLSLAILRRRLNKRDAAKDVLEKATLIKDIRCTDPIRAHIEILHDFALPCLREHEHIPDFVRLHAAWERKLDSYALSNAFYREIADWYFWAHHQVDDGTICLPLHCDTASEKSLFLIRLLTRVIFCWFLVEKRLIPADLFRGHRLKALLKDFAPSGDAHKPDSSPTYYRAILQNLFFGTLNMPPENRAFREKKKPGERYDQNYGITNLWRYEIAFHDPAEWKELAAKVPFLNGGLFDCLDDKTGKKKDNFILDGFSDREDFGCHLPNDLFFGPERPVDLSKDYGEEKKKSSRSKKARVRGLIEILSRYKFTIEENTPLEEEIALDPELLGKVFENLLASFNEDTRTTARKALGAFYTPREIVSYMVDEALKSYLSTQVPRCKGALDDLFSNKATLKEIKPDTREALIAAIGRVKILDPACGSGAFPMGALHRLVDLLQKLDPNNESWKRDRLAEARRYRQILEQSNTAKDELAACDSRIADIEKSFDTRYHALDFARKLYLIENCIYGVDIQPIATQIAKLRFFISLVVDQKVEPKVPNLGVRPLPNLETRLVAADTLIPLPKPKERQGNLFDDASSDDYRRHNELKQELARVRHEHFNARSPALKRKLRDEDERIRRDLRDLLKKVGLPAESARAMAAWDPYDQNTYAPFFDSEWMFGLPIGKVRIEGAASATLLGNLALVNEAGGQGELIANAPREIDSGFDVVIGNPPYVQIQKFPAAQKARWERQGFATYGATADIYCLFYERGTSLLKHSGVLAFITSNKFLRSGYGTKLRIFFRTRTTVESIVDFGELPVFTAATDTAVLVLKKRNPESEHKLAVATIKEPNEISMLQEAIRSRGFQMKQEQLKDENWTFESGNRIELVNRLRAVGKPMVEYVNGRFYYGIKTGLNEAFVVDRGTRDRLIAEHQSSARVLKPFINGGDLKRWHVESGDLWLLFIPWHFPLHEDPSISGVSDRAEQEFKRQFPAVYKHLSAFKESLANRNQAETGVRYEWYALQRWGAEYWREFEQPKVVFNETSKELHAYVDRDGISTNKTCFIIIHEQPEHLLAILMSKPLDWLCRMEFPSWGDPWNGGRIQFRGDRMAQLPIPSTTDAQRELLTCLAIILGKTTSHFASTTSAQTPRDPLMVAYWERVLNGLVYELYFPEELHAAGLHIFDLVAAAKLPDVTALPEADRLPRLRQKFEELHDGAHPLRIALDKLQTLDTVRIIEGKA